MVEIELAWAAGFIDGEGCIYVSKVLNHHKNPLYYLHLESADMLEKMQNYYQKLRDLKKVNYGDLVG